MLSQLSRSQGARSTVLADLCWGLAVISRDSSLAERTERSLERDGLMVSLVASGSDLSLLREAERSPTVVVIGAEFGEHRLEKAILWTESNLPHALVIVVVQPGQHVDAGSLLALGADGLLYERDIDSALGPMCRLAAAGHVSMPASMRHSIEPPALSHRERQALGLALAGLTNAQIARTVFIAESTVKSHLSSAFRRLGVHSRREAVALLNSDAALRASVLATLRLSREFTPSGDTT
jgi:two-component system NarL family response regulator